MAFLEKGEGLADLEDRTVGTNITADLEKDFQELISQKLLIMLSGINYHFQSFSGFALLAEQITGISLRALNSSKQRLKLLDLPFPELTL